MFCGGERARVREGARGLRLSPGSCLFVAFFLYFFGGRSIHGRVSVCLCVCRLCVCALNFGFVFILTARLAFIFVSLQ